jgi:hypothetical protein
MFAPSATCVAGSDASTSGCYVDGSQMSNQTPSWDTVAVPPAQNYPPPIVQ